MNGFCDIVIMGDGFGQSNESKFLKYAELVRLNLLKREPFTSRAFNLNFWYINSKQSLSCSTSGGMETALTCDIAKIKRALGKTPMNVMLIISWKSGYGGANGQIAAVGVNQLNDPYAGDPNYCKSNIEARAFDGIAIHELGHAFGCDHDFTSANVMSYATNGGCFLVGRPFTTAHQAIINKTIDNAIQV